MTQVAGNIARLSPPSIVTSSGSGSTTSVSFPVPVRPVDRTTGGELYTKFIPIRPSTELVNQAWTTLCNTPNRELAAAAESVLEDIEAGIKDLGTTGYDVWNLPELKVYAPEDDSLVFEWATSKFRVGLSVERNPSNSGWYLVSSQDLGSLGASGQLAATEPKNFVPWLLRFIAKNS